MNTEEKESLRTECEVNTHVVTNVIVNIFDSY